MSDDDFGDDSFFVDDSFLREVDNIEASVSAQSHGLSNGFSRSVSLNLPSKSTHVSAPRDQGWTGVQRSFSGPSYKPTSQVASAPKQTQLIQYAGKGSNLSKVPGSLRPPPSSDDYDSLPIPAESLAAFDNITTLRPPQASRPSSSRPSPGQGTPSLRLGMGRSSNANNDFLQTHLNFRREKQSTKGKRWDRTEFAETGRRVGAEKGKGKGAAKGKSKSRDWNDADEDLEDEENDWADVMAPAPKSLVDISAPYEPQRHLPNAATINTYIYPTNRPKRDYQYDIVKACFADNCLVALPTGLGKTFVAGVVMLNFYRWFPTGKIVFLAPTRPLVNQQIEACQLSCGIPSKDAAVMTGSSVSHKERARLWDDRRVFYCTPQTLDNDLKRGAVDPRDIVLAVFDEAHKASGSYAYTTILAYLTAHHPYFRVLALTATPGADVPRVQGVVDALHISRIEIREAEAPEIRKYMNDKHTERHVVVMSDVIAEFRDRWATLMRPQVAKLVEKEILNERDLDCKRLRPFRLTAKRMEIGRDRTSGLMWAFGSLTALEKMARAMGSLLEFSIGMFHTSLVEIAGGTNAAGKKSNTKGSANSMRNNTEFQKLLRDVEIEMNMIRIGKDGRSKADKHPKMQKTLELLLAHFSQAEEEEKTLDQKNDTRAMVFCSYRPCVLDIVEMLNQHSGLLRATKFVGQSHGKGEDDKGFNQKEQKQTINEFKEGKYNILVSTSIGEEGLDIGEVDFVVIYDMPKQSIKLLQRIGRTGRKRDGKVHVLMSELREDLNWDTAQQTHREIQEEILHSRNLVLFEDVEPLILTSKPLECLEQEMEIDPWDPNDQKYGKALAAAEKLARKEREKQEKQAKKVGCKGKTRGHEIPEGAGGFSSVADLLRSAGKIGSRKSKKRYRSQSNDDEDEQEQPEEMEVDEEEELRSMGKSKKRNSTSSITTAKGRKRAREQSSIRSDSEDGTDDVDLEDFFAKTDKRDKAKPNTRRKRKTSPPPETAKSKSRTSSKAKGRTSLLDIIDAASDSDPEISAEPTTRREKQTSTSKRPSAKEKEEAARKEKAAQTAELERSALDFFNTQGPLRRGDKSISPMITPPSSSPERPVLLPPSPEISKTTSTIGKLTPRTAAAVGFSQIAPMDMSWDIDEDDLSPALKRTVESTTTPGGGTMPPPPLPSISKNSVAESSSPFAPQSMAGTAQLGHFEPTQHPVRRLGMRRPRPIVVSSGGSESPFTGLRPPGTPVTVVPSSEPDSPIVAMNRLRRRNEVQSSPPPVVEITPMAEGRTRNGHERGGRTRNTNTGTRRERQGARNHRRHASRSHEPKLLDLDAELSGSDSGDTSEHSDSSRASSSDLRFANDFAPTQAPKGYNQRAIYLAGLGTQARGHGLNFRRDAADARAEWISKAHKPIPLTDDEDDAGGRGRRGAAGAGRSSESEYELGSFVVDDDDDDL